MVITSISTPINVDLTSPPAWCLTKRALASVTLFLETNLLGLSGTNHKNVSWITR